MSAGEVTDTSLPLVALTDDGDGIWFATGELRGGQEVVYRFGDPVPYDLAWFLDEYHPIRWYRMVPTITGWER